MYVQQIPWKENYDEAQMPGYTLPEVLRCQDGTVITDAETWRRKRCPELLQMFKDVMYGEIPPLPDHVRYELLSEKRDARGGTVTWQQDHPWQIVSPSGEILESGDYGNPIAQMFDDVAEKLNNPSKFCCSLEMAKEHTKIIEKLHRDYPIIQVPAEQMKRIPEDGRIIYPA